MFAKRRFRWSLPMLLVFASFQSSGCSRSSSAPNDIGFTCASDPKPPRVGKNEFTVKLTGAGGQRITQAHVQIEGDMSHPGMSPAFAEAAEVEAGVYKGTLELKMRGDWTVLMHITLKSGQSFDREVQFQNVQAI